MRARWAGAVAIALALLVSVHLRTRGIVSDGLLLDEFGTLWAVGGDSALETIRRVHAVHGQSPLYYLIVRGVVACLGTSDLTLRLPSLVLGCLVPLLAGAAAGSAFGRRAGRAALVLAAVDPTLVAHARLARPYVLADVGALLAILGLARALATGSGRSRALLFSGVLLAIYGHYVFAPVLPALVLAVLLVPAKHAYARRLVLRDAAIATALLVPAFVHMAGLMARREELAWVRESGIAQLRLVASREALLVLALALAFAAFRALRARAAPLAPRERVVLAFATLTVLMPVGALLGLRAMGTNIFTARYLALAVPGVLLLVAWAVGALPRAAGAVALFLVAQAALATVPPVAGSLGEAAATLEQLAPSPGEPVLLSTAWKEADQLPRPGAVSRETRSFLASPLAGREPFLLTASFDAPGQAEYLERELAPRLESASRFFVLAESPYEAKLSLWLQGRFPGRFHLGFRSHEYARGLVVARYERELPARKPAR